MGVVEFPQQGTIGASLKPKRYDIEVYQDDSFEFNLAFKFETTPIDVTGWVGLAQVKDATDAVVGTADIDIVGDPADGLISVNFDTATAIPADEYKYDIQFTDAGGKRRTFIGGKFTVTEDISE